MSYNVRIDPQLASAASARIFAHVPEIRELFAKQDLSALDGGDLERLMMAAFLMGYGDGYMDAQAWVSGGEESEMLAWALANT